MATSPAKMAAIEPGRLLAALAGRPIVLVGLMGAGKTVIGRKMAARLAIAFVDADHEIEAAAQLSVAEIFEHYGEVEFRRLEARVLTRLLNEGPMVLATGGGAFINDQTRASIKQRGVSIWLSADLDLLMSRVLRKPTRPLLQTDDPRATMKALMDQRHPIYRQADLEVPSRDTSKEQMAEAALVALAGHLETADREPAGQGTTNDNN